MGIRRGAMRKAIALALLGALLCAAASNHETEVETLDDLHLVEVTEGNSCASAVAQGKVKCAEKLAYYKKIQDTNCGMSELKSVMARIARNTKRANELAQQLNGAEGKLRSLQYTEGQNKGTAAAAKVKVLTAMVRQYHQKQALMGDEKKVKAELKDENSTRSKANRATHAAEKMARTEKHMSKVDQQAGKAKGLWAQMVQEKVNVGRAYWKMNKDKSNKKVTDKMINRLFKEAVKARTKEEKELKKIKDATTTVAKDNAKVTKAESKIAKEEQAASKEEQAAYKKMEDKLKSKFKKGMTDLEKKQITVKHYEEEVAKAQAEVNKMKSMNLKATLAQTNKLMKPVKP